MLVEITLQGVSAIAAILAAFLWWKASSAYVPAAPREDGSVGITMDGGVTFFVGTKRARLFETLQVQSKWNSRGAIAATVAASAQGLAILLSMLSA